MVDTFRGAHVVLVDKDTGVPYNAGAGSGAEAGDLTHGQNALSTTAEAVVAANAGRFYAEVQNLDAAINVYLGKDNTVTTANGYLLGPGRTFGFQGYVGAIWAIAASGTPSVAMIEW